MTQVSGGPVAGADKSGSIVLADVGGTNARFAVLTDAALGRIEHLAVADYKNFVDALAMFMSHQKDRGALRHATLRCGRSGRRRALRAHQ